MNKLTVAALKAAKGTEVKLVVSKPNKTYGRKQSKRRKKSS